MADILNKPFVLEPHPFPLSQSSLYELRATPNSGRGVFASTNIPAGTLIHSTATPPTSPCQGSTTPEHGSKISLSPLAWLIQRPYRKEACAHCFAYNRGREWKLKVDGHDCGVVFCSDPCRVTWLDHNGEVGVQAWEALETGVKSLLKRHANAAATGEGRDIEMKDANGGSVEEDGEDPQNKNPSEDEITAEWDKARLIGEVVMNARTKAKPSKTEKKVVGNVVEQGGDPDLMYYLLTAVISAYNVAKEIVNDQSQPEDDDDHHHHTPSTKTHEIPITTLLSPLFTLTPTPTSYQLHHTSLPLYTTSYLYLLTLLPPPLLPHLTPHLADSLSTRAAHNAFSLRPEHHTDGPDSGEFLGWAVYPSASFFNHSCGPNLEKWRHGRVWEFRTRKDVEVDEELCITYLGGEEETVGVGGRRGRLSSEWGFWCMCWKCVMEEEQEEGRV